MFLLYNLLLSLLSPIWAPMLWLKSKKRKESPNWAERMGNYALGSGKGKNRVWFHAVSVGEVLAIGPIIRETRKLLPESEIVLSVTTSSGHATARGASDIPFDHLVYFPIDVARFQLIAMQRVRPRAVAIMETELWPNFLWAAKTFDASTFMINGRISDRSYPRAHTFRRLYQAILKDVDQCLMQTEQDVLRIKSLGASKAVCLGNCKFDQAAEILDADPEKWIQTLHLKPDRPIIVIGSTRGDDEEALVLAAIAMVGFNRVQIIHAPRHIEKAEGLAQKVESISGAVALRSKGETGPYLVLDTYGELAEIYSVADIVVIGGGFAKFGGQNLMQPLALGKPVIHGPYMQNFRDVTAMAAAAGSTIVARSSEELADAIESLLAEPTKRAEMGLAARNLVQANLGASCRYAEAIATEVLKAKV